MPAFKALPLRADPAGAHAPLVGGSRQSLAVTSDGQLFTWGWNQKWSLGLGHQEGTMTAKRVEALDGMEVTQARGSLLPPLFLFPPPASRLTPLPRRRRAGAAGTAWR